jgi:hypothetical protein
MPETRHCITESKETMTAANLEKFIVQLEMIHSVSENKTSLFNMYNGFLFLSCKEDCDRTARKHV